MNTLSLISRAAAVVALSGAAFAVNAQQAPAAPDRAAVEAAFARADANKDGMLSKEEADKLPAIAAKFTQLDKNKDGMLSLDEFAAGYTAAN